MAKSRENKELRELGEKCRAGRLLTEYLRGIGIEKTELMVDPTTGQTVVMTKAEAMARKMWLMALGYQFDTGSGKYVEVPGSVNTNMMKLILERIEGKAGVQEGDPGEDRPSVADRVSEVNRRRLNAMAESGE